MSATRHTFEGEGSTITVIVHDTLDECVTENLPSEVREAPDEWLWGETDGQGGINERRCDEIGDVILDHHKCWGFARGRTSEIHVWLGDAPFDDVLSLLGHEHGHLEPRQEDEEMRADSFGRVAVRAYKTTIALMGDGEL